MDTTLQLQHLYWRAGFGPRPQDVAAGLSPRKALRQLLRDSETYEPLDAPAMHFAEPLGAVMAVPPTPAPARNPVPTGMVTTPDQATTTLSGSPAATPPPAPVPLLRPRPAFRAGAGGVPVLRTPLATLAELPAGWRPTIICLSGDIGWQGTEADYKLAKAWLDELLAGCGLDYTRVLVAAGNHDIIRNVASGPTA